jgi:uncharacterized protein (TIGR01777 family)
MLVLISGGTGLIGSHLVPKLITRGHKVILLSRLKSQAGRIKLSYWDPSKEIVDKDVVASADAIIHLAGTNIGKGRWTNARKKSILESRVNSARVLFRAVSQNRKKPEVFISSSGVNFYGMITTDNIFYESDPPGDDFLSHVCMEWENAALSFESVGIRTVIFRNGLALARNGGIISRLYLPFKLGLGVIPGTGKQYVPWIHMDDLCNMYVHAIENENMRGVYNAVAPEHVNFRQFSQAYATQINRKIILPRVPSLFIRIIFGEMSGVILRGSRVSSEKIPVTGFRFQYPFLNNALRDIFKTQR